MQVKGLNSSVVIGMCLLVAGAVLGMSSILKWVATTWYSFFGVGVYSHGYLVLALAIWVGRTHWRRNPPQRLEVWWWGLVPLSAFVIAMAAMELLYVNSSRALLLPASFVSGAALVFGLSVARRLFLPALFVYLGLLPFWLLQPALQSLATKAVGALMSFSPFPFYIEEFYIHIPAGTFLVASSCSGLSVLLAAVTLSTFYGAMYLRTGLHRVFLLGSAMLAALVSNWIRIWTLILIGQYSNLQHPLVGDHYLYGMAIFLVIMVPVGFLARFLENRELRAAGGGDSVNEKTGLASNSPRAGSYGVRAAATVASAFVGALLLSTPGIFASDGRATYEIGPLPLPDITSGQAVRVGGLSIWRPQFANALVGTGTYETPAGNIEAYRAVYPQQDREHHLFADRRSLHGRQWRQSQHRLREVLVGRESIRVNEFTGSLYGGQRITLSWYEVAGQPVTSRLGAKLAEANALRSGRSDGVVIAVSMSCRRDCADARQALEQFLLDSGESLRWRRESVYAGSAD